MQKSQFNTELKICLILDNPRRDLAGLTVLAATLAGLNARVYLVPQYDQAFEVPAISPDIVILNYCRPNNLWLIRYFHALGIKVIILDTEGAPGFGPDTFARKFESLRINQEIYKYFFWGDAQASAFKVLSDLDSSQIEVVGNPRYDFCYPTLRESLFSRDREGYVLVNTSFPMAAPRFSGGANSEKRAAIASGYQKSAAEMAVKEQNRARMAIADLVLYLAEKYPSETFVFRVHPFESDSYYRDRFIALENVYVENAGTSLEAIYNCKVLLQLNCSTAIEAFMLGKKSVSPEFINSDFLRSAGANRDSSVMCETLESLERELFYSKSEISISSERTNLTQEYLRDFLNFPVGFSFERVKDLLMRCKGEIAPKIDRKAPYNYRNLPFKQKFRLLLGARFYDLLKFFFLIWGYQKKGKTFSAESVQKIIDQFSARLQLNCSACRTATEDYEFRRLARFTSVRVSNIGPNRK